MRITVGRRREAISTARFQQQLVTRPCHPFGAIEEGIEGALGSVGIDDGIESQNVACGGTPIDTGGIRIKQPKVQPSVEAIVLCQMRHVRRWIEWSGLKWHRSIAAHRWLYF